MEKEWSNNQRLGKNNGLLIKKYTIPSKTLELNLHLQYESQFFKLFT